MPVIYSGGRVVARGDVGNVKPVRNKSSSPSPRAAGAESVGISKSTGKATYTPPKKSTKAVTVRKTPVQTYEQFKTPEDRAAAIERQRAVIEGTKTTTGIFANQEAELKKAGYVLNEKKNAVLNKQGQTVAGVTKTGNLFSGSKTVENIIKKSQPKTVDQTKSMSEAERFELRKKTSLETMGQLETLDEPSKLRESEIQRALNYGRGVQFAPTLTDPTRIVASTPTLAEVFSDATRAIFGGKAPEVPYLKKGYQAEPVKGILPSFIDIVASGKLSPVLGIIDKISGGKKDKDKTAPTIEEPVISPVVEEKETRDKTRFKLAGSFGGETGQVRSLFTRKSSGMA